MRNRDTRSESGSDALVRAIARHGTTHVDGETFEEQLARGVAKARERADDETSRNEDARDGYRAIAELGAILARALGVPAQHRGEHNPEDAAAGNTDPVVALSVARARLGAYARSDPVDRTIVFPGERVWVLEIEQARRETPDTLAVWRSRTADGRPCTRAAGVWIHGPGATPDAPMVVTARWHEGVANASTCILAAEHADASAAGGKAKRAGLIERRQRTLPSKVMAEIMVPVALAWLDAHRGDAPPTHAPGRQRSEAGGPPRLRTVAAPTPAAKPNWLTATPKRCAERIVIEMAREGWRLGARNPIGAWRSSWAGWAESGVVAWGVMGAEQAPFETHAWADAAEALKHDSERHRTDTHPAVGALATLVRRMLAQTGRTHLASASTARTLVGIEIPTRLWQALREAGPAPDGLETIDRADREWLVEIERPGDEDPELLTLWSDGVRSEGMAAFVCPEDGDREAISVMAWRTNGETVIDHGAVALRCPAQASDPGNTSANTSLRTLIEGLGAPRTGAIARARTAIALHIANRGEPAPLGPYRPAHTHGSEKTEHQDRSGYGTTDLFALDRAPDPERSHHAIGSAEPGGSRTGTALQARQRVQAHFKRQAIGPGRKSRRLIVIESYYRGPAPREDQIAITRLAETHANARESDASLEADDNDRSSTSGYPSRDGHGHFAPRASSVRRTGTPSKRRRQALPPSVG